MVQEKEDQGFTVSDRRQFRGEKVPGETGPAAPEGSEARGQGEREGGAEAAEEPRRPQGEPGEEGAFPPLDFLSFILSLAGSVHIHLGEIPDPVTGRSEVHPELAKQTIDLLAILQEKTKGNLTGDEERILNTLLSELQMRYLKAVKYIP